MVRVKNDCCGCAAPAYPCLGDYCPLRRVTHYYCDECGEDGAVYNLDGSDMCEECAIEAINERFDDMDIFKKAKALGFQFNKL